MKNQPRGFGVVELVIGLAVTSLIALGSTLLAHQTLTLNMKTHQNIAVTTEVENAVHWISRDAQMAETILTQNLNPPNFIEFSWTEWGIGEDTVYHTVIYTVENSIDGIGDMKRTHWSSGGLNNTALVARALYLEPEDNENTSIADYSNPVLSLKLVVKSGTEIAVREFNVKRRTNFSW